MRITGIYMLDKERKISERSLQNLKLGAKARYQGKIRQNVTILPVTLEWLRKGGNVSSRIDDLAAAAMSGELKSNHTHDKKDDNIVASENVYKRIEELEAKLSEARSHLEQLEFRSKDMTDQLCQCHLDASKATEILKAALKLKSNSGGAIKREIEKALLLIDDV